MLRKILTIIFLATLGGCSSNPVSTERLSDFDIQDYSTFQVSAFAQSDDVRVSPFTSCLLYTSPSPRDRRLSRMPSSA